MPSFSAATPVLRSFDEAKAREFYLEFLGFSVVFEHRFDPTAPLYLGLKLGDCVLHLSEHFGDSTPGGHIRIQSDDVVAYWAMLNAKAYKHARPGRPELQPWKSLEMTLADPFGNRLTFAQS